MILVTGATGQLGRDVVAELEREKIPCVGVGSQDLDITQEEKVYQYLAELKPAGVIHCAAYTAVDKAEEEGEKERCFAVNHQGTAFLAGACRKIGAKLLYISTDYVFSGEGDQPHEVEDSTAPLGVYGASKRGGELAILSQLEAYFILRISWVFGEQGNNFVKTMLRLGAERETLSVVDDQVGSPTYTRDLAVLLREMIQTEAYGVYHGTNEGFCSWADFAQEIMNQRNLPCTIQRISSQDFPTKAARPKNSRLSKKSLQAGGFSPLRPWKEALESYLKETL